MSDLIFDVPSFDDSDAWGDRHYLPHYRSTGTIQFITYRLADSMSVEHQRALRQHDPQLSSRERKRLRLRRTEALLDAGYGSCVLRHEAVARIVVENWYHFDAIKYRLMAWVIMPNHVHLLIRLLHHWTLSKIFHSWRSYTSKRIVAKCREIGVDPPTTAPEVWKREPFDRVIRDEQHLVAAENYIHNNPVKAGLVNAPAEWPWSSANERWPAM